MAMDVVGIGEAMALFDPVEEGDLTEVDSFKLRVAGAEFNSLIALSRLGHRCGFASAVGDDAFGRLIRRVLISEGISTDILTTDNSRPTGLFVRERRREGDRKTIYFRKGSAASAFGPSNQADIRALQPRCLIVSGLTLGLDCSDGLGALARKLITESASESVLTVFDVNIRPGVWSGDRTREEFSTLLPRIQVLLGSEREFAELTDSDPYEFARTVADNDKIVVVKRGAKGVKVFSRLEEVEVDANPVDVVDVTGAGDAFAAGFVSGLLRGWPMEPAARLGTGVAAHAISASGDWEGTPRGAAAEKVVGAASSYLEMTR